MRKDEQTIKLAILVNKENKKWGKVRVAQNKSK